MPGGARNPPGAYWEAPGGTKHSRGIAVVREGEWRHEEVAPSYERRRGGEAAGGIPKRQRRRWPFMDRLLAEAPVRPVDEQPLAQTVLADLDRLGPEGVHGKAQDG